MGTRVRSASRRPQLIPCGDPTQSDVASAAALLVAAAVRSPLRTALNTAQRSTTLQPHPSSSPPPSSILRLQRSAQLSSQLSAEQPTASSPLVCWSRSPLVSASPRDAAAPTVADGRRFGGGSGGDPSAVSCAPLLDAGVEPRINGHRFADVETLQRLCAEHRMAVDASDQALEHRRTGAASALLAVGRCIDRLRSHDYCSLHCLLSTLHITDTHQPRAPRSIGSTAPRPL